MLGAVKSCETTEICAAANVGVVGTMGCCDGSQCTWYGNCVSSAEYATACDQVIYTRSQRSKTDTDHSRHVNRTSTRSSAPALCIPFASKSGLVLGSFHVILMIYSGYKVPGINVGFFSCDSVSQTGTFDAFLTTFNGETDARTWEALYDTDTGSSPAKIVTSSLGSSNAFGSEFGNVVTVTVKNGPVSTTSGPPYTPNPKATTKKTSIGPIIGGVVGGIAVIGAIIAGVIVVMFMKKGKNNANAAAALPPTNMNNTPPGQPPPPQGPYPQGPYPPQQQQQYPQQYQQQQQFDQNAVSPNPDYFAAGKTDQNYYVKQDGGAQITEQAVPVTPLPPTSPAPPYVQPVQQGRESWNQSPPAQIPPPQMMQQVPYQPPQLQSQGPAPVELGTNASTPQRNAEGRPIYEAA